MGRGGGGGGVAMMTGLNFWGMHVFTIVRTQCDSHCVRTYRFVYGTDGLCVRVCVDRYMSAYSDTYLCTLQFPHSYMWWSGRLQGSVARAVSAFNQGATEMLSIMNKLYVDLSYITLQLLTKKDQRQVSQADAVQSAEACEHRRAYAAQRRHIARDEERRDSKVYSAGEH